MRIGRVLWWLSLIVAAAFLLIAVPTNLFTGQFIGAVLCLPVAAVVVLIGRGLRYILANE